MNQLIHDENDWMKEAPLLASLNRQHPFKVPDGYFEELPVEIENKISFGNHPFQVNENYFEQLHQNILSATVGEPKPQAKVIKLRPSLIVITAIAACLIIFALFYFKSDSGKIETAFNEEWTEENILAQVDESTLIEMISASSETTSNDSAEEIEQYLLDNNIDLTEITSEF